MTDESPDGRVAENADTDETTARRGDGADAASNGAAETDRDGNAEAGTDPGDGTVTDGEATDGETARTSADEGAEGEPTDEGATDESEDGLVTRAATYDEELADDVAELEGRVQQLETELAAKEEETAELADRLKRTQADFQNYKKRAKKRQDQIRETATEDFVERVVTVRDNLVRALDQDEEADIRPGVESTLEEFDRILAAEDVAPIDPEPGTEVDPTRHEVMMRVDSDHPEGTVADVYQPGYEMADNVIREAQVTVSTGEGDGAE